MATARPNKLSRGYSQYQSVPLPERWPLATNAQPRSDEVTKDARLINSYAELDPQTGLYTVQKRPGFSSSLPLASGSGNGMYNFQGDSYDFFGTTVLKNGAVFASTISDFGIFRFEQTRGATPKLVYGNGVNAFFTDGTTQTQITDPDFPTSFCKGWAYLNGTLYVLRPDGGIQGSNPDNPALWDPLNLIFAQVEPDRGIALAKQLTYVVALKQWSTEIFFDNGNPTGSPLSPVQGGFIPYGCSDEDSVAMVDGTLLWVTQNRNVAPQVIRMDDLKVKIISTPPIERLIRGLGVFVSAAFPLKVGGHRFYVLSFSSLSVSLVYDLDQELWHYWTNAAGTARWPINASSFSGGSVIVVQNATSGETHECDCDYIFPGDAGIPAQVDIYTPNFDYGIFSRIKNLNKLVFDADLVPGSTMLARCSDDDYENYTNFREVNLGSKLPLLSDCGSFNRRSYNFRHKALTKFRIKAVELQIDIGT